MEIIAAYGSILEKGESVFHRESDLPFPKEIFRQALAEELVNGTDAKWVQKPLEVAFSNFKQNSLEVAFLTLEFFLPDDEFQLCNQMHSVLAYSNWTKEKNQESLKKEKRGHKKGSGLTYCLWPFAKRANHISQKSQA